MRSAYPVIDLFAGPGGLGEGFATIQGERDQHRFRSVVSIERDEFSHATLFLRHFLRSFSCDEVPDDYYRYLKGDIEIAELYRLHKVQFEDARKSALRISLGEENHDEVRRLITKRLAGRKKWALVGGPPCQAYSLVGRARMIGSPGFEKDERHFLYREYLKIIIDHQPPVFVMENVKGLLSAKVAGESVITRIVSDLSSPKAALENGSNGLGYRLYSLTEAESPAGDVDPRMFLLKAEEFGVPQARHRMFIVGIRNDVKVRPGRLRPHKPPTVMQTINNLPAIRSGLSRANDTPENWRRELFQLLDLKLRPQLNGASYAGALMSSIKLCLSRDDIPTERFSTNYPRRPVKQHQALRAMFDPRLNVLVGHEARPHMASDLRRYLFASTFAQVTQRSPKLVDFPVSLLPAHKNVERGRSGEMFADRFKVQLPHQVATTITSHISKDGHYFIHYDPLQCRSLTVREVARLQTFPDNYKFEGTRTKQYHQIGNAVPPYLARQIAEIIADVLDSMNRDD